MSLIRPDIRAGADVPEFQSGKDVGCHQTGLGGFGAGFDIFGPSCHGNDEDREKSQDYGLFHIFLLRSALADAGKRYLRQTGN